jgi:hypothetical protein
MIDLPRHRGKRYPSPPSSHVHGYLPSLWRAASNHFRLSRLLSLVLILPAAISLISLFNFADPTLRLGSLVDPETFQLLPAGDPRLRDSPQARALQLRHERTRAIGNMTRAQLKAEFSSPVDDLLATSPSEHVFDCEAEGGPLLWIGIFTTAQSLAKRQVIRTLFRPDLPRPSERLVEVRFISGRPPNDNWKYLLERENDVYRDMVILDSDENMDDGKTWHWLSWLARERGKSGPRPRFVLKSDDDVRLGSCASPPEPSA